MIKFKADKLIGFGLSEENIKRLKAGKPIMINLEEMGMKGQVLIFYGETEGDMIKQINPYIGKDTKIHE